MKDVNKLTCVSLAIARAMYSMHAKYMSRKIAMCIMSPIYSTRSRSITAENEKIHGS